MSRKHVPPRTLNSLLVATQSFCEALWSRSDMHVSQFPRLLFLEHLLHGLRVAPQEKLSVFADWRPFTSKNAEIPSWVWFKQIHPEAIRKQENTECSRNTTTATTQMSSCMILCSLVRLQRGEIQETGDRFEQSTAFCIPRPCPTPPAGSVALLRACPKSRLPHCPIWRFTVIPCNSTLSEATAKGSKGKQRAFAPGWCWRTRQKPSTGNI